MKEIREEKKHLGFKRLFKSFTYSFEGLKYAFRYEQNMLVHGLVFLFVILFGIYFKLSLIEWILIILVSGLVIATELINTSIEAVVDLTCPDVHPLAKIAKDTASAAVFVFALTAVFVGLIIFVPYFIEFIGVII